MAPRPKHEEALSDALDRRLLKDPQLRRLTKKILRAGRALQAKVSKPAWQAYLLIDELTNHRHGLLVEIAIRLALRRGRRLGRDYALGRIDGARPRELIEREGSRVRIIKGDKGGRPT
jgi:hypothetical protein